MGRKELFIDSDMHYGTHLHPALLGYGLLYFGADVKMSRRNLMALSRNEDRFLIFMQIVTAISSRLFTNIPRYVLTVYLPFNSTSFLEKHSNENKNHLTGAYRDTINKKKLYRV